MRSAPAIPCPVCQAPLVGDRCVQCGAVARAGRYRVRARLGQSPHGRVYLAETDDGLQVALKELTFRRPPKPEELEAVEREAALQAELTHPRIPQLIERFVTGSGADTRMYLVLELVEGHSLDFELASGRRFSAEEVLALGHQALEAISYLQAREPPVIHRAVKPANLILDPQGQLHLVGFEGALELGPTFEPSRSAVSRDYLPPEQARGHVDLTTDVYSVAAMMLNLLTGTRPSPEHRPRLLAQLKQTPRTLQRFVHRALSEDPASRYPLAVVALRELMGTPVNEDALGQPPSIRTEPGYAGPLLLALGLLLGLLGPLLFPHPWTDGLPRSAAYSPATAQATAPPDAPGTHDAEK